MLEVAEGSAAVVTVLVALVVLLVAAFALRRRSLTRLPGSFDCSVRQAGSPWVLGIARFGSAQVQWWKVFSLSPRPGRTWRRDDLAVLERRWPGAPDGGAPTSGSVLVRCEQGGTALDLAMSPEAYTGFASWLESAPPGPSSAVT